MEVLRKKLKNDFILISILMLSPLFLQGQVQIEILSKKFKVNEYVQFKVKNQDSLVYYLNIRLEKFSNNEWLEYSSDVFSDPFNPLELTLILKRNDSLELKFRQNIPAWYDDNQISSFKNKKIRKRARKGEFRLKILYSKKEGSGDYHIFSEKFIIE